MILVLPVWRTYQWVLTNAEDITISIRNFGINDITDPEVQYAIDGGTPVMETHSGTISAGTTEPLRLQPKQICLAPATMSLLLENQPFRRYGSNDDATKPNQWIGILPTSKWLYLWDGITKFVLETITNDPIPCGSGYEDFTSMSTTLEDDTSYTLTVQTGYDTPTELALCGSILTMMELLKPASNFFADVVVMPNNTDVSIPFTVPAGVTSGDRRLRIRCGIPIFQVIWTILVIPCNTEPLTITR